MSLWKRGKVYWTYVYLKGVRHQKSTGTANRRQAELCELEFKKQLRDQALRPPQLNPEMSFAELAAQFVANAGAKTHHYERLKNLLPFLADTPIGTIDKALVQRYVLHRQSQKRKVKDATINRDVSVLRHLMYWACDQSWLERNPLARLKMLRERRTKKPVLSIAEEQLLLSTAQPRVREMIIAALDTGMRRGEILNQLWEDVDFERRLLFVTKSKTPEGESREIPLTQRMYQLLVGRRQAAGVIFSFQDRNIFSIKRTWKTTLQKAGTRHIRFHDLRHTFNTRLMESGIMQEIRKALMGHSGGGDINSIYTHVELPTKRRAIQMLEAWCAVQLELQRGGESDNETNEETLPAKTVEVLPDGIEGRKASD